MHEQTVKVEWQVFKTFAFIWNATVYAKTAVNNFKLTKLSFIPPLLLPLHLLRDSWFSLQSFSKLQKHPKDE